jgi:hypothetical protein
VTDDLIKYEMPSPAPEVLGQARDMRGEQQPGRVVQLMSRRQGFWVGHVERGPDVTSAQRRAQGRAVHQLTAAHIDQKGPARHPLQEGRVDELLRRGNQRHGQHHDVRDADQIQEVGHGAHAGPPVLGHPADLSAEGPQHRLDGRSDAAVSDQQDGGAVQRATAPRMPGPRTLIVVEIRQPPQQRQRHRDNPFGARLAAQPPAACYQHIRRHRLDEPVDACVDRANPARRFELGNHRPSGGRVGHPGHEYVDVTGINRQWAAFPGEYAQLGICDRNDIEQLGEERRREERQLIGRNLGRQDIRDHSGFPLSWGTGRICRGIPGRPARCCHSRG